MRRPEIRRTQAIMVSAGMLIYYGDQVFRVTSAIPIHTEDHRIEIKISGVLPYSKEVLLFSFKPLRADYPIHHIGYWKNTPRTGRHHRERPHAVPEAGPRQGIHRLPDSAPRV